MTQPDYWQATFTSPDGSTSTGMSATGTPESLKELVELIRINRGTDIKIQEAFLNHMCYGEAKDAD